jgi:hypothetical protein
MEAVLGRLQEMANVINEGLLVIEGAKRENNFGECDTLVELYEKEVAELLSFIADSQWKTERLFRNS